MAAVRNGGVNRSLRPSPSLPRLSSSPTHPKMHLPQELVDYIVDFLHDDPRTLIQGSLVSRAWVGRTRSYLCETLKITRSKHVSSNSSHLPPLCGYVKALHFTWPGGTTEPPPLLDCFEQSELHTLVIHSCQLAALNEQTIRRSFAKFPCASITTLELHEISPTRKTLLILLSLFPNVDDLTISVSRWWEEISGSDLWEYEDDEDNDETAQQISSPRLRGSFKFFDPPGHGHWGFYRGKLLHTLAALPLQFQTVSLDVKEQSGNEISTFLNSCSETVRRVFVGQSHRKPRPCIPFAVPHAQRVSV